MKVTLLPLFPSMVSYLDCDNFHVIKDDLIKWIYDYKKDRSNEGLNRSNIEGAWHSPDIITTEKSFERFNNYITQHILLLCNGLFGDNCQMRIDNMWFIINPEGSVTDEHQHPGGDMSGSFYIKCQGEESGRLIFRNSNIFGQNAFLYNLKADLKQEFILGDAFWVDPVEGRMLLFPSDVRHGVQKNTTTEDRIVISFNIMLRPKNGEPSFYNRAGLKSTGRNHRPEKDG